VARPDAPQIGWRRVVLALLVGMAGMMLLAACSAGGGSQQRGNARVNPTEAVGRNPNNASGSTNSGPSSPNTPSSSGSDTQPARTDGVLSSAELGLVYQLIIQRFVDKVDHATLVQGAVGAIHDVGMKYNALPVDMALVDLVPPPAGSPERDWSAFARGYDALAGKYPTWASEARPDWAVLRRMLAALNDDHSIFIEPDEYRRMNETGFTGVGVRVTRPDPSALPYVVEVFRDSPAAGAGVQPGDQIVAVDGQTTQGRSLTEVVTGIRGAQGTPVVLTVTRGDRQNVDLRINRRPVDAPRVEGAIRGNVLGVLRIRSFADGVPEAVQQLLTQGRNRGARAWIVDLRGNPGGSIDAMARVASNFIDNRAVGLAIDRSGQREPITASGRAALPRFPFVVLVDHETAAGTEVLAAAIHEYQVAPIVGTRTAGSVGLAVPQPLSDGSAVQLTIRRLVSPSGAAIDKLGVQPDIEADLTVDDLQKGEDPQFMRAVELLAGGPLPSASPVPSTISR
jgi:carboxyl-terminal processing protease